MKAYLLLFKVLCVSLLVGGCADMDVPTPMQIVKNPIGLSALKSGMSKNEVMSIYGEPNMKSQVCCADWNGTREEWFYRGRYTGLPVGAEYLSEDVYLYFDGDNLTNISKEPLGRADDGGSDNAS